MLSYAFLCGQILVCSEMSFRSKVDAYVPLTQHVDLRKVCQPVAGLEGLGGVRERFFIELMTSDRKLKAEEAPGHAEVCLRALRGLFFWRRCATLNPEP